MDKKYLVVGRGLIGTMLDEYEHVELISHSEFRELPEWEWRDYEGYVCTAAVQGEAVCQKTSWDEVVKGNVQLPMELLHASERTQKPVVLFSTSGVYKEPGQRKETDDVEPHNRYTASKLMMEYAVERERYEKAYIFRIPFVCLFGDGTMDMPSRVSRWVQCEDVETSIVYREHLCRAVTNALREKAPGGLYNVKSTDIRLPEFVKDQFDWDGEVLPQGALGLTPSTCLDMQKAMINGLLWGLP